METLNVNDASGVDEWYEQFSLWCAINEKVTEANTTAYYLTMIGKDAYQYIFSTPTTVNSCGLSNLITSFFPNVSEQSVRSLGYWFTLSISVTDWSGYFTVAWFVYLIVKWCELAGIEFQALLPPIDSNVCFNRWWGAPDIANSIHDDMGHRRLMISGDLVSAAVSRAGFAIASSVQQLLHVMCLRNIYLLEISA